MQDSSNILQNPVDKNTITDRPFNQDYNQNIDILNVTPSSDHKDSDLSANTRNPANTRLYNFDIDIEMNNLKENKPPINTSMLLSNPYFDKFIDSLDQHKHNNHRIPQLSQKAISDDHPFADDDDDEDDDDDVVISRKPNTA